MTIKSADIDYDKYIFYNEFQRIQPSQSMVRPDLEMYWVTSIEPSQSSLIIKLIKQKFQYTTGQTKHLKRFKKKLDVEKHVILDVAICPTSDIDEDKLREILKEGLNVQNISLLKTEIPTNKPFDRELNMEWSKRYWPLVWKGNPMVQELHESFKLFSRDTTMKYLEEISDISEKSTKDVPVVTMFVDPRTDTVKSIQEDERCDEDPMKHSIMCCIDDIAKKELKRRQLVKDDKEINSYLCLNYDVYTTHEPCTMCAMALLHSRIGRLIYIEESPVTGAIGEKSGCRYMIHISCTLNWKYECFRYMGNALPKRRIDPLVQI
ncbi:DEKNAAC101749 [Brettanomyces naardenensis]|uniref:DEKNAAC101749 n=1 Tax=Brettanomyces naardenensis TaxID=13370 RepID=A0A448YIN3_BRENA|nr:DEKNAAC101749 [Brettanomyces naardenensis]